MNRTSSCSTLAWKPVALAMVMTLPWLVVGCGDSSSSSDGPDGGDIQVSLSEEEQVVGAAVLGTVQAGAALNQTEQVGAGQEDPLGGSSSQAALSLPTASQDEEVAIVFECPHPDAVGYEGEGAWRYQTGSLIDLRELDFPDGFKNASSLPEGQDDSAASANYADDFYLRTDCVVREEGGDEVFQFHGSANVAQLENVSDSDGRAVAVLIGGYTGPNRSDAPDTAESMVFSSSFGDENTTSSYRAKTFSCSGCVDGDLGDFSGDAVSDVLTRGFMEMDLAFPGGFRMSWQVGGGVDDPFTMRTSLVGGGTNQTKVELDGLLAYMNTDSGCGFDVTYNTLEPLSIAGYDQDEPETVAGKMEVTLNETGNIYTVEFTDGQVTVTDSAGNDVTPEPTQDAQICGFVAGDSGDGGAVGGADDPNGTWVSECKQIAADEWGKLTLIFDGDSNQFTEQADVYSDSFCTTHAGSNEAVWDYEVGDPVGSEPGAYEIDFLNGNEPAREEIFDIFKIENGTLYLGAPDSGPDSEEYRPETIDEDWAFTKQ